MPILNDNNPADLVKPSPVADVADPVTTILVTESTYADVGIDTRWTPLQSIMSHIAGSVWEVTYFSQVIDTDSQLMPQSPTVSAAFQQYRKIEGMQLRVSDPLNIQQDDTTKMMQIDGSAIVFAAIIPNEGDMFTADIGLGKPAVFRVATSAKKAIFKEAAYDITYAFASTDEEYIHDLEMKTVQSLVFKKDFLNRGQNPLLLEEEAVIIENLEAQYRALADNYFNTFFNNEYKTLTVPGQTYSVYDPFLVKFVSEQFTQEDSHLLQDLRVDSAQFGSQLFEFRKLRALRRVIDRDAIHHQGVATFLESGVIQLPTGFQRAFTVHLKSAVEFQFVLECLQLFARFLILNVLFDDRQRRAANRRNKITVRPERGQASPQADKLLPQQAGASTLQSLDQAVNSKLRVNLDQQVNVVGHNFSGDNFSPKFRAGFRQNGSQSRRNFVNQNFAAVLRAPDDVVLTRIDHIVV